MGFFLLAVASTIRNQGALKHYNINTNWNNSIILKERSKRCLRTHFFIDFETSSENDNKFKERV